MQIVHNGDHLESLVNGESTPLLVGDMDAQHWAEAWAIAVEAGQVKYNHDTLNILVSEDLY